MQLDDFHALDDEQARQAVDPCLGVPRWVDEVVGARPYVDVAALIAQARASAENLTDDELALALQRHPRIGERAEGAGVEGAYSTAEQAGVDAAAADRLHEANIRYESAFDRVFLIAAAGRDADEILGELERRIDNEPAVERREVVANLRQIALQRLEQVVTS